MARRRITLALKAAVTVLLLGWLLARIDLAPVLARLSEARPAAVLPLIAVFVAQIALGTERWRQVAHGMGVDLPRAAFLRIFVIGLFFNQALPSMIGGDAVRVWLATRAGVPLGRSVSFVLCDRIAALLVLVAIVALTLPLFFDLVSDPAARAGIALLAAGGVVGFSVVLVAGDRIAGLFHHWRLSRPLGTLASDFRRAILAPRSGLLVVVLSGAVHLLTILIAFLVARALALEVGFVDCLVLMPPVVLLMMVPISIAGWGLRESAMVVAFGFVGVAPADALAWSVAYGLAALIGAVPGGFVWLAGDRRALAPPP